MSFIDIVIIIVVFIIVGLIIYFSIWRNRKKPCKGCPYAKNCNLECEKKDCCKL